MPEIYLFVQYLLSMSVQHQTWQALGTPEALVWLDSSSRKVACIERGRSDSDDPLLSGNVIAIYAWQGRSQILGDHPAKKPDEDSYVLCLRKGPLKEELMHMWGE